MKENYVIIFKECGKVRRFELSEEDMFIDYVNDIFREENCELCRVIVDGKDKPWYGFIEPRN